MKLKALFVSALAMLVCASACKKTEEENEPVTISPEALNFNSGTKLETEVSIKCSKDWRADNIPSWIVITMDGEDISSLTIPGSSQARTVKVTASANKGLERSAVVTINGGSLHKGYLSINQDGVVPYTSISDIRALFADAPHSFSGDVAIKGTVISNRSLNNLTSPNIAYIQDATGGIVLRFNESHSLDFGQVIAVNLKGKTLNANAVALEISTLATDEVSVVVSETTVTPKEIYINDFTGLKFESQYIALKNIQISDGDINKNWVVGDNETSINAESKSGETFVIRSGSGSTFRSVKVAQGAGTLMGIATTYQGKAQIVFAQESDWSSMTGERFEKKVISTDKVSEVLASENGTGVTLSNAIVTATAITHPTTTPKVSFLVTDSGLKDYVLVYDSDAAGLKIGDVVTVSGTRSQYPDDGNTAMAQISGAVVKVTSTVKYSHPKAEDITAGFDSFSSDKVKYVSVTGTLTPYETYFNIAVQGAKRQGTFLTPENIEIEDLVGVEGATFTGYYLYTTGKEQKYNYLILTEASVKN